MASSILQEYPAMALSTGLDLDNISFSPLPAESKIWLLALYVDGEKAFLDLQQTIANKLPYKLDFKVIHKIEDLKKMLQILEE